MGLAEVFGPVDSVLDVGAGTARQITIEFHSFLYPSQAARIEKAIALLSELGFYYIDFSIRRIDVLFINSGIIDITGLSKALLVIQKYQRGIAGRLGQALYSGSLRTPWR